ncbi:hypothetical protein BH23CHL2_BH23CHL2_27800 [soil metagenome]
MATTGLMTAEELVNVADDKLVRGELMSLPYTVCCGESRHPY